VLSPRKSRSLRAFKFSSQPHVTSFGGIFFGYDSGYINGVTGSAVFIESIEGPGKTSLTGPHNSLITSILSCGTFFGALIDGDLDDMIGIYPPFPSCS
jgi:hypothetical protein